VTPLPRRLRLVYLLILAIVLVGIALPAWNICRMKVVDGFS